METDERWPDAYSYWGGECHREPEPRTPSMPISTLRPEDREKIAIRRGRRDARRLRARWTQR